MSYFEKVFLTLLNDCQYYCSGITTLLGFLTSAGVTSSLILKSLEERRPQESRLCYWSPSYARLDASPEWGNHGLSKNILYRGLSVSDCDREASKKRFKNCLKKILWCLLHRPQLMGNPSWEPGRLASHHQPYSLLLWNHLLGRSQEQKILSPDQTSRCSCCDRTCLFCLILIGHEHTNSQRRPSLSWSSIHEAKPL